MHFACRNRRRQPPWERGRLARIVRWRSPNWEHQRLVRILRRRQPPRERGRLVRILRWRSPITGYAGGMSAYHAFAAVAAIKGGRGARAPRGRLRRWWGAGGTPAYPVMDSALAKEDFLQAGHLRTIPSLLSQRLRAGEAPALPGGGYADGGVQPRRLRTQLWIVHLQRRIFRRRDTCVPYLRCCRSNLGGRGARAPRGRLRRWWGEGEAPAYPVMAGTLAGCQLHS